MTNIMITGASNGIGKATFDAVDKDLFDNIILIDKKNSNYCDQKKTSMLILEVLS
jgi:NADP-dependent 3-hydroxy acid dehydrogenase YdfG